MLAKIISLCLPWPARRRFLNWKFGYEIDPAATIGLAWIFPRKLIMGKGAKIDHFSVAVNLDLVQMGEESFIGRNNWITGFPTGTSSLHFAHQHSRVSELQLKEGASITKNHHIDCTSSVLIGRFSTIAGYNSQLLTHSIDIIEGRQDSQSIEIGAYSFIGTNSTILGGSVLPDKSVLGAKSLLNKKFSDPGALYAGVPAQKIKDMPNDAKYFTRQEAYII